MRSAIAAIFFAVLAGPALAAPDVTVTDAAIKGGKLVVTGTTATANMNLKLDDQFTGKSNAAKNFTFSVLYLPPDCIVAINKTGAATKAQAVVANCAARGLSPQGAWSNAKDYVTNDVVTQLGSVWRALKDSKNKSPSAPGGATFWEKFVSKGDTGAVGPKGNTGNAGAQGDTGAQGDVGLQGEPGPQGGSGAQGDPGPQGEIGPGGAQGQQGPSGVVATYSFAGGGLASIGNTSNAYVFNAVNSFSLVTITVAAGQHVIGFASAVLGTSGGSQSIDFGLCYQPSAGGQILNFAGGVFETANATGTRLPFATGAKIPNAGTSALPAGTYTVGFCVKSTGAVALNNNDFVNGWVMVVKPSS